MCGGLSIMEGKPKPLECCRFLVVDGRGRRAAYGLQSGRIPITLD